MDSFKVLVLAGGQSSRMGSPKHLLPFADQPLYAHLIQVIHAAFPDTHAVYISLAACSYVDENLRAGCISIPMATGTSQIVLNIIQDTQEDIGPAAGLLAAHNHDANATWMVVACDYPSLEPPALRQLLENYESPGTCFKNVDGFCEPLLGIWSPHALEALKENVEAGRTGPSYTIKCLKAKLITPVSETWMTNVNTRQEWENMIASLKQHHLMD